MKKILFKPKLFFLGKGRMEKGVLHAYLTQSRSPLSLVEKNEIKDSNTIATVLYYLQSIKQKSNSGA